MVPIVPLSVGHVTGGRVFGYDNVDVLGSDGNRSHVARRINEEEAAVVRRIFTLCSDGFGLTRITKTPNEESVPAPRPQQGRPQGWVNSTVREVLLRPLYRGEIVWNQTRKRDAGGLSKRSERPEDTWMRLPAPELRIVSDELWAAAHARFSERQQKFKRRRRPDIDSPYLLSGFARCGTCGGGLAAHSRQHGGQRVYFYGCTSFWKRGSKVCANNLVARMDVLDNEVVATLQDDVCRPAVIEEAIRLALEELAPARQDSERHQLETELAAVRQECSRLAEAIGRGGPLEALVARLADRQGRQEAIARELPLRQAALPAVNLSRLEARLRGKLADWRRLLRRNVVEGRGVLRALLVGPLRFTPVNDGRRRGYAFEGAIALDRLIALRVAA
jgi:hypothetical protein